VRLWIRGPGMETEAEVLVDTGFNGFLALPSKLTAKLGLRRRSEGRAVLADGSERSFDIYEALILWRGRLVSVPVADASAEPLLGTNLLYGNELIIQMIGGGSVLISELPRS
jgi:clan AA aspartic protease